MNDRRAARRQRVFKAGTIEFDGGGVDCTIRNMSPIGAALDVATPVGIPHEITLNIGRSKERQNCCIVWRKEKRIGVIFAKLCIAGTIHAGSNKDSVFQVPLVFRREGEPNPQRLSSAVPALHEADYFR
jgi:hypothetical protein